MKFADTQKEKEAKKIQQINQNLWNISAGGVAGFSPQYITVSSSSQPQGQNRKYGPSFLNLNNPIPHPPPQCITEIGVSTYQISCPHLQSLRMSKIPQSLDPSSLYISEQRTRDWRSCMLFHSFFIISFHSQIYDNINMKDSFLCALSVSTR